MPTDLDSPTGQLTLQFLAWVAETPRSYRQAMDAWRTSCPRMPVWEDAVDGGLVEVTAESVRLSTMGAELLRRHG